MRAGFRMILEAETDMEMIGEAVDGLEALTRVQELEPQPGAKHA